MISFPARRRIGAMVNLIDGSKPTTPAPGGWASCRRPRNASGASNPRQMKGGKGGNAGNLMWAAVRGRQCQQSDIVKA